jgi:hypothetical protein
VKLNLKAFVTIFIIGILLISSIYVIYLTDEENEDNKLPSIENITGDISGKLGDIITISTSFSDNMEVTKATLYYKTSTNTDWFSQSILSGKVNISLDSSTNIFYYVTVDDAAGNGPVGKPSIDGSLYYTISVFEDDEDEQYIRNVFVEDGSFTTCMYCPIVAEILYDLYSSGDYNFYYVNLIRANDKAIDRLDNEYNLWALPTVFVDGGYKVLMSGGHEKSEYAQAIRDAEYRDVPDIELTVSAEYDNKTNELISNVLIKNKEDDTYNGRLRVYLTEKISRWSGPEGEPYHFGFLDFMINKEISITGNTDVSFNETRDISDLDAENLMVIGAIFNSEKNQGYSDPPRNKNPFDAYYADAADGSEVVEGGNLPPTVGLSLPELGKMHILGIPIFDFIFHKKTVLFGRTKMVAEVHDDSGIEKVEFYIDGKLVGEDTDEPYEYSFRKVKLLKRFVRKHMLQVIAYDKDGKTGTSESMEVIAFWL